MSESSNTIHGILNSPHRKDAMCCMSRKLLEGMLTIVVDKARKCTVAVQGGAGSTMQQVGCPFPPENTDIEIVAEVSCREMQLQQAHEISFYSGKANSFKTARLQLD